MILALSKRKKSEKVAGIPGNVFVEKILHFGAISLLVSEVL